MKKTALLRWNLKQIKQIKRDLLFFGKFVYDDELLKLQIDLLKNVGKISSFQENSEKVIHEIYECISHLQSLNYLEKFNLREIKQGRFKLRKLNDEELASVTGIYNAYDKAHKDFINKYDYAVAQLETNYSNGYLKYLQLLTEFNNFADTHVRFSSVICNNLTKQNIDTFPLVQNLQDIPRGKKEELISITINNIPIPDDIVPFDEIIDFKNEQDKNVKYLRLISWINNVSKSSLNINELKEEVEYLLASYKSHMENQRIKYKLTQLEVYMAYPMELIENLVKFRWSQIPKMFVSVKKAKAELLIGEAKSPGAEVAYIVATQNKYKKNT